MSTNDKQEVLQQLERIHELLEQNYELHQYIENGCIAEHSDKAAAIKAELGPLPGVPAVCSHFPVYSTVTDNGTAEEHEMENYKKLLIASGVIAGVTFILDYFINFPLLSTITTVAVVACIVLFLLMNGKKGVMTTKRKAFDEAEALYKSTLQAFQQGLKTYEEEKAAGIEAARDYGKKYKASYTAYLANLDACMQEKDEAIAQFVRNDEEIKSYGIVPAEYYIYVSKVITLLRSGRADSYKEALNLAIAEEREEQEAAARRAEEARRTRILEQQAAEERRHNQQMEYQQAQHDRQMERAEQDRARAEQDRLHAEKQQAKLASERERDARKKAEEQCRVCAKFSGCRNHGVPGCGAFVPRR